MGFPGRVFDLDGMSDEHLIGDGNSIGRTESAFWRTLVFSSTRRVVLTICRETPWSAIVDLLYRLGHVCFSQRISTGNG